MYMTKRDGSFASPPQRAAGLREYGRGGLFGLLTPQGNPTAEPEMRILLPPASVLLTARLTSRSPQLRQRLIDYGERLDERIDAFDTIAFDAVGLACTGASYWTDPEEERRRGEALAALKGYPIVTAAGAVKEALRVLGVGKLALVSPYPAWLAEACQQHWERQGLRVSATLQLPAGSADAHGIYGLTTPAVLAAVSSFDTQAAEAILLAGTGMPSLRVILALQRERAVPVLSSNLCLAWALARMTAEVGPGTESRLYGGWAERLAVS
jgi:maleate isomerase